MSKTFFIIATGIIISAGCTLTPEYVRPDAPVPGEWPTGPAYREELPEPEAPLATELPWKAFFTDARLQTVIEKALVNNRDFRLAALNVEAARALYGVQRGELYPAAYATADAAKQRSSADLVGPGQSRTSDFYSINLGILSWELDFFGRIRSLEEEALESYLATEQARRSTQILLISNIAQAYLALAADRETLALAQDTYDTQKESYELVKQQYDLGIATELDLRRAQIPVEAARGDMARYTQQVAQNINALVLLAGSPIPEELLPEELNDVSAPREVATGIPSEVLLRRPDIVAAEHQLRAANAFIGAARAAFFPRISLTTTFGTASDELFGLFGSGTGTWSFAPQAAMPLFDARTWFAHRVSKVQREIAVAQYENSIQNAFREVADALAIVGTIDEQVAAQEALVEALDDTYRLALARFERGLDNYLSVLDAQRSLFDAQQVLVTLHLAQQISPIRLYSALGGGWE